MPAEARGHRLLKRREARGRSVLDFAGASAMHPDVLEIERGQDDHHPVDILRHYAEALGTTLRVEVEVADVRQRIA